MGLSYDEILKVLRYIEESEYNEMLLEINDLKIQVSKQGQIKEENLSESVNIFTENSNNGQNKTSSEIEGTSETKNKFSSKIEMKNNNTDTTMESENTVIIRAPMLGTFYRSPSPEEPPFVEEGDEVSEESSVCIIEVMKLFNTIPAKVSGKVIEILVNHGEMVEYNQPLLLIEKQKKRN